MIKQFLRLRQRFECFCICLPDGQLSICLNQFLTCHQRTVTSTHSKVVDKLDGAQDAGAKKKTQYATNGYNDIQFGAKHLTAILIRGPHWHHNCYIGIPNIGNYAASD